MDDDLTPTEYLILEVLAARFRLGEHLWPFPNRFRPALRTLHAKGLVSFQSHVTAGNQAVRLTVDGEHRCLDLSYRPPAQRAEDAAQETGTEIV